MYKYNVTLKDKQGKIYQVEAVGKDKETAFKNARVDIYTNEDNQVYFMEDLELVSAEKGDFFGRS